MKVIQDTPVSNIVDDKLGRENIVDLVVDSINAHVKSDHPCLVYGIYGKWGEGKTSLMNFIKSRLLAQGSTDNISLVEFNPWLVENQESLLKEFFARITVGLDRTTRKLFRKYCSAAILASKTILNTYAPGIGAKVAEFLELAKNAILDSEESLSDLKMKTCEALKISHKHLLVMIDDVDRLDKEELHAVLRLIRQVADFDNCIYIVAMDIDIVSKSIGEYYGTGNSHDGRKFVDKIVQVPITLPYIPKCDMQRMVEGELSDVLDDYVDPVTKFEITLAVTPFFSTYRELKRYCNQLQFVLPHLSGEVNMVDLCLLEAIKNVSAESYHKIYEHRMKLLRQVSNVFYLKNDQNKQDVDSMCQQAKEDVVKGLDGNIRNVIINALDYLFAKRALYDDKNIVEKRLNTDIYFTKYFAQGVPSNLIPDRILEDFKANLPEMSMHDVVSHIDGWASRYPVAEIKRASLYAINHTKHGIDRCKIACVIAKALSICSLSYNTPTSLAGRGEHISMFVSINLLKRNRYYNVDEFGDIIVENEYDLYKEALGYIVEHAEINFAMGVFYDLSEEINDSKIVLETVMPILIKRFKELSFAQKFEYSRKMLVNLFSGWCKHNQELWNEYSRVLVHDEQTSCLKILEKFVPDKRDVQGMEMFLHYFGHCVDVFNKKLQLELIADQNDIVRSYFSNYEQLLKEQK